MRSRVIGGPCAALLAVAVLAGCGGGSSKSTGGSSAATPLAGAGPAKPGRVVDGIECAPTEQLVYHIHQHLAIYVDGKPKLVPYGIGIGRPWEIDNTQGPFVTGGTCFSWLHTHAYDGIIHVESPTERRYTLGDFFDVWGQKLSATQVGPARGRVTAFVNGKKVGSPRAIVLTPHAVIQLDVGSPVVKPLGYYFPAGL